MKCVTHFSHYPRLHCIILTLMLEIPQNPLPYDRESFLYSTDLNNRSTVLVELPADPMAEEGLPPYVVVKLHFARFQERH